MVWGIACGFGVARTACVLVVALGRIGAPTMNVHRGSLTIPAFAAFFVEVVLADVDDLEAVVAIVAMATFDEVAETEDEEEIDVEVLLIGAGATEVTTLGPEALTACWKFPAPPRPAAYVNIQVNDAPPSK